MCNEKWENLYIKVTRLGLETTLHVVAAILRMLRDPRTLPFVPALWSVSIPYELG